MRLFLQLLLFGALFAQTLTDLFPLPVMGRQTRLVPLCICPLSHMWWLEHFKRCRFTLFKCCYPLGLDGGSIGGFFRCLVGGLLGLFFPLSDKNRRVDKLV